MPLTETMLAQSHVEGKTPDIFRENILQIRENNLARINLSTIFAHR